MLRAFCNAAVVFSAAASISFAAAIPSRSIVGNLGPDDEPGVIARFEKTRDGDSSAAIAAE